MRRLGIFSYFGFELPLEERLRLIAEAGFQATSLWLGAEEASVAAGKADDMPRLVRDVGLVLDNAHASYADCQLLWSDCEEESNRVLSDYERALEFCHEHEIPTLVAHITAGQFPASFTAPGLKNIEWLVQRAETVGVILAIENTRKPDYIDLVFSNIGSSHLAFCYDSCHDFLYSPAPGHILSKWGYRLETTHFSDTEGARDDHLLPQDGTINWEIVLSNFPEKYSGAVMLEVCSGHSSGMLPEQYLNAAFDRVLALAHGLG